MLNADAVGLDTVLLKLCVSAASLHTMEKLTKKLQKAKQEQELGAQLHEKAWRAFFW